MTVNSNSSKIISFVTSKGFQIHPDALFLIEKLKDDYFQIIEDILSDKRKKKEESMVIITDDIKNFVKDSSFTIPAENNKNKLIVSGAAAKATAKAAAKAEHGQYNEDKELIKEDSVQYSAKKDRLYKHREKTEEGFKIVYDSNDKINSGEGVEGYASLFRSRYEKSLKILSLRQDSKRVKKIETIKQLFNQSKINYNSMSKELSNNSLFVAGLIMNKDIKNNNYDITIDDQTGLLTATTYNDELKKQISMLTVDQMVMIEFENNLQRKKNTIKNLFSLDIPDRIPNKSKSEIFSILISDLHIGSKFFMEKEFQNFLEWLNGKKEVEEGKEESNDDIISKIKYICICGDLIDGIGIFPNQDKELLEKDSFSQMDHAINILSKIPKHMKVFLIPGNHDLGRRALPQPAIPKKYAEKLYSLDNVTMLGNPCMINMEGIKILMFHGQSLDDIIASIPGLSYSKPAEAMKLLLKSRHLSPIYGQRTPIAPEKEDMMIIEEVPDVLHSGHVHVIDVDSYKGTLLVNSGAWQSQTPFQQTMGITPTPGIAIAINLSNLKPYKIDFNNQDA